MMLSSARFPPKSLLMQGVSECLGSGSAALLSQPGDIWEEA